MSAEGQELNHKLEEVFEFLNRLKSKVQSNAHNAQEDLKPEQILEELQEAHALAAPFHSNFVVRTKMYNKNIRILFRSMAMM